MTLIGFMMSLGKLKRSTPLTHTQYFVYHVLGQAWLGVMNKRFRRVLMQKVGEVWYDKKQQKTSAVFGKKQMLTRKRKVFFVKRPIIKVILFSYRIFQVIA